MIFKLLEIISRYYYKISNIIESYSFIEKKITPLNETIVQERTEEDMYRDEVEKLKDEMD